MLKNKKWVLITLIFLFLSIIAVAFILHKYNEPIGTIGGAEWDYIVINNKKYEYCTDSTYNSSDKNKKLGKIKSGDVVFNIYSIKGTDKYLYCRWEWEGRIYKLIQE